MGFDVWARWLGLPLCLLPLACGGEAQKQRTPEPPSAGASSQAGSAGASNGGNTGQGGSNTLGGDTASGAGGRPVVSGLAGGTWEGGGGAGAVYCQAYGSCGLGGPSCAAGLNCYSIPGCATAICIDSGAVCEQWCKGECEYLLSYPGQLACSTGKIMGIEGSAGTSG